MKFGRKPFHPTARTDASGVFMDVSLSGLGAPPASSKDYISAVNQKSPSGWGMLGNNAFGDCVEADDGHYLMLRTANAGAIVIPTTDQVLKLYSVETGFNPDDPSTDLGTDETADCDWMVTQGLLGHKADATGFVVPTNMRNLKWCIQLFGGCKFGVNFPQSAMDQFNAGQPWTVVADDGGIIGGHDVLGVKYDGTYFYVVTWGALQPVAPAWLQKYCEEAHCLLFSDWITQNGAAPSGFKLSQLLADLSDITIPPPADDHRHHHWRRKRWASQPHVQPVKK